MYIVYMRLERRHKHQNRPFRDSKWGFWADPVFHSLAVSFVCSLHRYLGMEKARELPPPSTVHTPDCCLCLRLVVVCLGKATDPKGGLRSEQTGASNRSVGLSVWLTGVFSGMAGLRCIASGCQPSEKDSPVVSCRRIRIA